MQTTKVKIMLEYTFLSFMVGVGVSVLLCTVWCPGPEQIYLTETVNPSIHRYVYVASIQLRKKVIIVCISVVN